MFVIIIVIGIFAKSGQRGLFLGSDLRKRRGQKFFVAKNVFGQRFLKES